MICAGLQSLHLIIQLGDAQCRPLSCPGRLIAGPAWTASRFWFHVPNLPRKLSTQPCSPRAKQATFHNITRIMDCVGCEKCKMWAKLQVGQGRGVPLQN